MRHSRTKFRTLPDGGWDGRWDGEGDNVLCGWREGNESGGKSLSGAVIGTIYLSGMERTYNKMTNSAQK